MFLYELLQHAWVKRDTAGQNKSVVRKGLKACSSCITAGLLCVPGSEWKAEVPKLCFSGHLNCLVLHNPAAQNHQQAEALQTFLSSRRQSIARQSISGAHLAGWHGNLQHNNGNCMQKVIFEGFVRPGLVVQEAAAPERAALSHARLLAA